MTEQKIVFYKGGNWDICKEGFIICECGRRYYNSYLSERRHIQTKTHVKYLSLDNKEKANIKFDERSIQWDENYKKCKVVVQKDGCNYHKSFSNLQDAIKYRDEHSYIEERIEIHKPKPKIKSEIEELIELEKELQALINN